MKVWTALFNFICIFVLIILIPSYYTMSKAMDKELDQLRLDMAVDKATEAVMYKAADVEDIELDYVNPDAVILTPGDSIDTFCTLMCFNYDMEPTSENKNKIETSICSMVLCDEFGFYIAETVEDDITPDINGLAIELEELGYKKFSSSLYGRVSSSGNFIKNPKTGLPTYAIGINTVTGKDYNLRWSVRTPYTEKTANGYQTMGFNTYPVMTIASNGQSQLIKNSISTDEVAKQHVIEVVNSQINKAIEAEITRRNASGSFDYKFYLPTKTTSLGVNPITSPSVMIMLNNATYASSYSLDAISVGGYKVQQREYIVCFENANGKWYCYAKQLPDAEKGSIKTYVKTMKDACDLGYRPWWPYLMNPKY